MPHDHIEHEPGVLVFAPAAPLNFTNVQDIVGRIRKAIATRKPPVKLLVIEASGIIDIDYTGAQLLRRAIVDLRKKGITVAIARLSHEQASARPDAPASSRASAGTTCSCRSRRRCTSSDRETPPEILDNGEQAPRHAPAILTGDRRFGPRA
jgi:MFS superfamily sulfate permease-like transporter